METELPGTNEASKLKDLELALDLIFPSESLADLCKRTVLLPTLKNAFEGAHVLLTTNCIINYDCGYGLPLPTTHEQLAAAALTTKKIQFAAETTTTRAMIALPFIHEDNVEAIGILLLHKGTTSSIIDAELEVPLKKLTGFFLVIKYGLDH